MLTQSEIDQAVAQRDGLTLWAEIVERCGGWYAGTWPPRPRIVIVCRAMRKPRQQCQARVLRGSTFCSDHQPDQPRAE